MFTLILSSLVDLLICLTFQFSFNPGGWLWTLASVFFLGEILIHNLWAPYEKYQVNPLPSPDFHNECPLKINYFHLLNSAYWRHSLTGLYTSWFCLMEVCFRQQTIPRSKKTISMDCLDSLVLLGFSYLGGWGGEVEGGCQPYLVNNSICQI